MLSICNGSNSLMMTRIITIFYGKIQPWAKKNLLWRFGKTPLCMLQTEMAWLSWKATKHRKVDNLGGAIRRLLQYLGLSRFGRSLEEAPITHITNEREGD